MYWSGLYFAGGRGSKLSLQMGDKGMQDDEEQLVILGNVSN